jgi:hypothetical protein
MQRLLALVLVCTLLPTGGAQTGIERGVIPPHTAVEIELLENLSSETLHAGQSVSFKIVRPVEVDGVTVMTAGMRIPAEVRTVRSSGAWRKSGYFDLVFKPVPLKNGYIVQLDFYRPKLLGTKGDKTVSAIETSAGVVYAFPLLPFMVAAASRRGRPYTVRSGERYLVYVVASERPAVGASGTASQDATEPLKP